MTKSTRTKMAPIERQARLTSKGLIQFHKMGVEANKAAGNYGDRVNERFAEKYGRTTSNVTHARIFANLVGQAELEKICKLRKKNGAAFGPGLATKLFPLKKRKHRHRILLRWKKESLSARQLDAVIRAEFGKSDRSGRKSTQPSSPSEAISLLHDRCSNWLKWYEQLIDKDVAQSHMTKLTGRVGKQLSKTIAEVKRLLAVTTQIK